MSDATEPEAMYRRAECTACRWKGTFSDDSAVHASELKRHMASNHPQIGYPISHVAVYVGSHVTAMERCEPACYV